ncbi:MAG: UrcA family protein [Proteobacteria bacterium]|nr:UrcA family protein [Pseudomonadota bacterium]
MSRIAVGVIAALSLCAATPAFAQQSAASTTQLNARVVPYGDLNLDSRSGADTMLRRIDNASRYVCGDRTGPRPMQENGSVHACMHESMETAVNDLGHPNVSDRYYGNTPEVIVGDEDGDYAYPGKEQ